MHFVNIGSTGINLTLVVRWDIYQREETVEQEDGEVVSTGNSYEAVRLKYVNGEYDWFEREEAIALRQLLEARVEKVNPVAPPASLTDSESILRRLGLEPDEFYRQAGRDAPPDEPPADNLP